MRILLSILFAVLLVSSCSDEPPRQEEPADLSGPVIVIPQEPGTLGNPIIDSNMAAKAAILTNLPEGCPQEITSRLAVVTVRYYGFDDKAHQGQIVVDRDLATDVSQIFELILESGFPVHTVLPIAHAEIQAKAPYGLSPDTDNSSGFAFRPQAGSAKLSMHARGWAVDLNPRLNPYIKGKTILPPRSAYDPSMPGTLTADHPVVLKFKELGWEWGGDWTSLKDYMHFEKVPSGMTKE